MADIPEKVFDKKQICALDGCREPINEGMATYFTNDSLTHTGCAEVYEMNLAMSGKTANGFSVTVKYQSTCDSLSQAA